MRTTRRNSEPESADGGPTDAVARFRAGLAAVKRRRRMFWGRDARELAGELAGLLADLRDAGVEGRLGVDLVAAFMRADRHVFEHCDDSSGYVGDVFRGDARRLFREFAGRCDDTAYLADLVFDLVCDDGYGVRDGLLKDVAQYLPEAVIRRIIVRFHGQAGTSDSYVGRMALIFVAELARQIGDVDLFERATIERYGAVHPGAALDIAAMHIEHGDPRAGMAWLARIPDDDGYKRSDRDELMFDALGRLGMSAAQIDLAWAMLRRGRGPAALDQLISLIGEENRAAVIDGEATLILAGPGFQFSDLTFLINQGRFDDAETYLRDHVEQVDGWQYEFLTPLATTMRRQGRHFGASLIYRALVESILERATYNAYSHGARYLRFLDQMSASVSDWRGLPDHATWFAAIHAAHARKSSFWARYQDA